MKRGMTRAMALAAAGLLVLVPGCGRGRGGGKTPTRLRVSVLADTARGERLAGALRPRALVWLERTSIAPPVIPPAAAMLGDVPPPGAEPDTVPAEPAPAERLDDALRPPLLRSPGVLIVPPRAGRASVELEVSVDERGHVDEARFASGTADTSLIEAARRCALGMRFYPALRSGKPVAVWCRQRFDFGAP